MKLRLDLHTHLHEATFRHFSPEEAAQEIVASLQGKGLDGIAITDHLERRWAFQIKEIVERRYNGRFLIIPGEEVTRRNLHIVELYLEDGSTFRFLAHPPANADLDDPSLGVIHGLEVENGHWTIDGERAREMARRRGLLLLSNSDAHSLGEIGRYFNLIDPRELSARAKEAGLLVTPCGDMGADEIDNCPGGGAGPEDLGDPRLLHGRYIFLLNNPPQDSEHILSPLLLEQPHHLGG